MKPKPLMLEINRVLKKGRRFVATTPKESAEKFIDLYKGDIHDVHERYFNISNIESIMPNTLELVGARNFLFGLNQVFCFEKIA